MELETLTNERRKFRSISEKEAQIIWLLCKKRPSGGWSGITQAVRKIGEIRRGKSVSRQTVYDFLEAHPEPEEHLDFVGRRNSMLTLAKSWEELPAPIVQSDDKKDENREANLLELLNLLRWRLWKDGAPLLRSGIHYSINEQSASLWIEWRNPTPFTTQVGRWGSITFPDKKNEEYVQLKRVEQNLDAVLVFFNVVWQYVG